LNLELDFAGVTTLGVVQFEFFVKDPFVYKLLQLERLFLAD